MAAFLRTHRRRAGLTLESLAASTGLTKSYLSKIERGLSTPSIAVALKIAEVLGTDVEQLFSNQSDASALVVDRARERNAAGESTSSAVYEPIAARMIKKTMQPFAVRPTTESDATFMDHPGEEFIYVQAGTVEVTVPDQVIALEQGDSVYFDSSTPHRVRSTSPERAVLLVVVYDQHDEEGFAQSMSPVLRRCGAGG